MIAAAHVTAAAKGLLTFKYQTPATPPHVVNFTKKSRVLESIPISSTPSRAASSSVESARTPERTLKRKSPADSHELPIKDLFKPHTRLKRPSTRYAPELAVTAKRSRSARLGSRWNSREPMDYLYTPPPKRARSDQPFGSKEKPVPRSCSNVLDGRVDQYMSKDVVDGLLTTYKACKLFTRWVLWDK